MVATLTGATPKHQQLRALILGMATPGQAIPSERQLSADYGVSRATVRAAVGGLVADGMLERVQGLGTFAVHPRLESHLHLASFTDDMRRRGATPSTRVLTLAAHVPPPEVATALALGTRERAWQVERLRLADDEPMALETGWYPEALFPDLDAHDLTDSLYRLLADQYGRVIDAAAQTLWAQTPTPRLVELLALPDATPTLVFQRRSTAQGVPVEHVTSYYRGDRYRIHMDLDGRRFHS